MTRTSSSWLSANLMDQCHRQVAQDSHAVGRYGHIKIFGTFNARGISICRAMSGVSMHKILETNRRLVISQDIPVVLLEKGFRSVSSTRI